MHQPVYTILALATAITFISCNAGEPESTNTPAAETASFDMNRAKNLVDSANKKFSEQIAASDSNGLASHYWPDAEFMLDYSEPIKGKDIVNAWGQAIRMGIKEMSLSTTNITGDNSYIIETGNYQMKDAKQALVDKGKYVVVWENRNGEWKIFRDIGSTSMAAPH